MIIKLEQLIAPLVVVAVVFASAALFRKHDMARKDLSAPPPAARDMWTVEYEGHWFVRDYRSLVHHPSCPCITEAGN